MKSKKWLWIGLAAAVVVALVVANVIRSRAGKVESVQLARVRVEDITSRVRAPGKIEAKTQVKVSADIMGKIVVLAGPQGTAPAPTRRHPVPRIRRTGPRDGGERPRPRA